MCYNNTTTAYDDGLLRTQQDNQMVLF